MRTPLVITTALMIASIASAQQSFGKEFVYRKAGDLDMKLYAVIASEPKYFVADHPFLFVIRDRKTSAVLFCGRVLEPKR